MKKLASITVVALFALFALTSCQKDYKCKCTAAGQDDIEIDITDSKKDDAESVCTAADATYSIAGYNCTLSD